MRPAYVSNQFASVATVLLGKRRILPFFPASLPDESLASRVTRFHFERGNVTTRETYSELFGASPFVISNLFLPRIEALAQRLPGDPHANVEKLIREGTLLPITRLFTASTATWASADYVRRSVGESGSTRICLQCIKEDVSQFDTAYLHRSHQIPAVTACWKHGGILLDHCPECGCPIESPKDLTLAPWEGCCGCRYRFDLADYESSDCAASSTEKDIARFASLVLTRVPEGMVAENLPRVLRDRALEMGFRYGKDKVDRRSLQAAMESHYSPTLLAQLDPAYAKAKTKQWLHFLGLTKVAVEGPLSRNLLLANYLFQDAEAFLAKLAEIEAQGVSIATVKVSPRDLAPIQVSRAADGVGALVERLALIAIADNLEISDLWRDHYGAMKRIAVSGSKAGIEALKKAIEQHGTKSAKKHGRSSAKVHPKDADWAEEIKRTASRLFSESGRPTRVSFASLVRNAEIRPAAWPDAISFPLTRAACTTWQESQWHFYARRVMWAMARYHGKVVARTVITESAGLEHHRATDVYHYLVSSTIVPVPPFAKQLEAKGITRDWSGPCPEKAYRKAGRGYQKTGVRTAYAPPEFAEKA